MLKKCLALELKFTIFCTPSTSILIFSSIIQYSLRYALNTHYNILKTESKVVSHFKRRFLTKRNHDILTKLELLIVHQTNGGRGTPLSGYLPQTVDTVHKRREHNGAVLPAGRKRADLNSHLRHHSQGS